MGFSWQVYWSGLPFPSPGDLPHPGIQLTSPALPADSLTTETCGKPTPFLLTHFVWALGYLQPKAKSQDKVQGVAIRIGGCYKMEVDTKEMTGLGEKGKDMGQGPKSLVSGKEVGR